LTLSPGGFRSFLPRIGDEALVLRFLARELTGAADGLSFLSSALFRRFLVKSTAFHLPEDAFALHLPLQCFERLVDVVVSDKYLQLFPPDHRLADAWLAAIADTADVQTSSVCRFMRQS
jgi:hypothetical protein